MRFRAFIRALVFRAFHRASPPKEKALGQIRSVISGNPHRRLQRGPQVLFVTAMLAICLPAVDGTSVAETGAQAKPVALGSAEYQATPARPIGWRGDGSGRFPGAAPVTDWSVTKNVRWKTVVGKSYSSPIVTGTSVFVTSEPNLVICVNRADGKIQWRAEVTPSDISDPAARETAASYKPPKDGSGMAAATPLTDGQNIYAVFANGIVCALGLDGARKWSICIGEAQNTGYGRSASPIFAGGNLIVHMTSLHAIDPKMGAPVWTNRDAKSSYGTPVVINVGQVELIVTPLGDVVRADDGTSVNSDIAHTGHSSPVNCGDGVVCFGDTEVNALRLGKGFKEEVIWSGTIEGEVFGTPLLHDGILFLTNSNGELFAFEFKGKGSLEPFINGRALLEEPSASGPAAYASITLAGEYLFFNSNKGEIVVLGASRDAPLINRIRLPGGTGASLTFSGKDMFVRDGDSLYCIGE